MLHELVSLLRGNKRPRLNTDTPAMKLVRFIGCLQMCLLVISTYLTFFGTLVECEEQAAPVKVNSVCYGVGVHIYADHVQEYSGASKPSNHLYPLIPGRVNPYATKTYLTATGTVPIFFLIAIGFTYAGSFIWSYQKGDYLNHVIGDLETYREPRSHSGYPPIKDEDRNKSIHRSAVTLSANMRFYNGYALLYTASLMVNVLNLSFLLVTLIMVYGNGRPFFGIPVFQNSFVNYENWPEELLFDFPTIAVCHFQFVGMGANFVKMDTICSLPWSRLYLFMFASASFVYMITIFISITSFMYHVCFIVYPNIREYEVTRLLILTPDSNAAKAIGNMNVGGVFLILLLQKNINPADLCQILERYYSESLRKRQGS